MSGLLDRLAFEGRPRPPMVIQLRQVDKVRIREAHLELFRDAAERVVRAQVREVRKLVESLGAGQKLIAELHRTARLKSDFVDTIFSPLLRCYAEVVATLAGRAGTEVRYPQNQGRTQVAAMISILEVAGTTYINEAITEMEHSAGHVAAQMMASVATDK